MYPLFEIPVVGPLAWRNEDLSKINVYCMYAILAHSMHRIDTRNVKFGDTVAVMKAGGEFLRRLTAAAESLGRPLQAKNVI